MSTTHVNSTSDAVTQPAVAQRRPFWRRPIGIVALLVGVLVVGGGVFYWIEMSRYENTDDAFIDGNIVQMSSKVAGTVERVLVKDNQDIAAGELLLQIDPRDVRTKLNQAQASLNAAKSRLDAAKTSVDLTRANTAATLAQAGAGVEQAKAAVAAAEAQLASAEADVTAAEAEAQRRRADLQRYSSLDPRAVSQQQVDQARAAAESSEAALAAAQKRVAGARSGIAEAQARVAQAQAVQSAAETGPQQIASAEAQARTAAASVEEMTALVQELTLQESYTSVYAPTAGRVTRKAIQPGQNVEVNQALLAIVQPDVWVTANFKETQLTRMRRGQDVDIDIDAYPGRVFHGKVESIQAGTGARFSLLPPENATGNYVKVVQRVPVKITLTQDDAANWPLLSLGMSVVPNVHTATGDDKSAPLAITPPAQPISPAPATRPVVAEAGQ